LAAVAVVMLALPHNELELTSFDPAHARVIGPRQDRLRDVLPVLLSFTVVAGVPAGVLLTSRLMITPATAAALVTDGGPRRADAPDRSQ
jgi:ABC-type Mn2+/Zn2+ transport system permease subunit